MEQIIKEAYYGLNSPACFSSAQRVLEEARRSDPKITLKNVENFLKRQRTYTLYHRATKKFPRLRTVPSGLHTDWQADLSVFTRLVDSNDGYAYLLVCVDVLSRQIFVEPVKTKSSVDMKQAFKAIFQRSQLKPWKIYTDNGVEFESRQMREYFKEKDILKFSAKTHKVLHATVAERANRTIKDRLYKYFSENGTLRWIDIIQDVVAAINHSVCRATRVRPVDVTPENADKLFARLYAQTNNRGVRRRPKFSVGQHVRIAEKDITFAKHLNSFSDQIYTIAEVLPERIPVVYRLQDYFGRLLPGYYYEPEMVRTCAFDQTTHRAEKILRQRRRNGVDECLIRWIGHSEQFDSWVPAESVNLIRNF